MSWQKAKEIKKAARARICKFSPFSEFQELTRKQVDEDASDSEYGSGSFIRAATVAEDGKAIKQEESLNPAVQFRATIEKKLDAMRVTKTHILHGLRNRIIAYTAARDQQLDLEDRRDWKRKQLNAWDMRYSKVQALEEMLKDTAIQQVFHVPAGQEETAPVVLWKADIGRKLKLVEMARARAFAAWKEDVKKVKDGERVMRAHMETVKRSGERVDGWRLQMEEAESLLKTLQKSEVEKLWE
ncbi:MAG TPA: hypothetical protein VHP31_10420 [Caproicibacter sp.]|nr:hypothetical protein [Caproicibacter sp.]